MLFLNRVGIPAALFLLLSSALGIASPVKLPHAMVWTDGASVEPSQRAAHWKNFGRITSVLAGEGGAQDQLKVHTDQFKEFVIQMESPQSAAAFKRALEQTRGMKKFQLVFSAITPMNNSSIIDQDSIVVSEPGSRKLQKLGSYLQITERKIAAVAKADAARAKKRATRLARAKRKHKAKKARMASARARSKKKIKVSARPSRNRRAG